MRCRALLLALAALLGSACAPDHTDLDAASEAVAEGPCYDAYACVLAICLRVDDPYYDCDECRDEFGAELVDDAIAVWHSCQLSEQECWDSWDTCDETGAFRTAEG